MFFRKFLNITNNNIRRRLNHSLIIAEHNNKKLSSITKNVLTAAKQINGEISIIVLGNDCKSVLDELSMANGVKTIFHLQNKIFKGFLPEIINDVIVSVQRAHKFTHILMGDTLLGKTLIPGIAAKLDVSSMTDIIKIETFEKFSRYIYANNAILTFIANDPIKIFTIRKPNFEPDNLNGGTPIISDLIIDDHLLSINKNIKKTELIEQNYFQTEDKKLKAAKVVIGAGKGLKRKENIMMIYELARKLDGAVGATRAAIDARMVSNDLQIGLSGVNIAPNLYIAIGISGAIQHVCGIKDSKIIVAINKDPKAPIFKVADYGLVGDLFKIVPELIEKLPKK